MATTERIRLLAEEDAHAGLEQPSDADLQGTARRFLRIALANLSKWSAAEGGALALWTPVAIGAGAVLYFSLKAEPAGWFGPAAVALALAVVFSLKGAARLWAAAALFAALGFAAADWRAARADAPILERELRPREIKGRLIAVEEAQDMRRLIIEVESIDRIEEARLPARIRLSWRGKEFGVLPGERITLRAGLSPPPPPAAPGAFDFARQLYFQRIGAVGYAVTAPERLDQPQRTAAQLLASAIEEARLTLSRRILERAPGEGGAIVAAVVTGKRAAISERAEAALRDAGLAHLLAISGLHMGLATGLIFFSVRFGLAAVEPLALNHPIKKWAAAAALLSGFIYLTLSGGGWSARRAFIMSSIMFIAILADRRALSLRNVAVAATIILLFNPEAVLHPGFQMSFAAVTVLIAAYEWAGARADPDRDFSFLARLRRYAVGLAATDTLASVATSPFGLFHFHRAALYGLAANIACVPIMGFWVMPLAIGALILMPLGLDGVAWRLAAAGVELILSISSAVASQPGAVATTPQWPPAALGILTLGGLWLCLQRAAWRLAGIAALPLSAVLIAAAEPPLIFISDEGDNAGVTVETGGGQNAMAVFRPRKDRFAANVWKEQAGLDPEAAPTLAISDIARCDDFGCTMEVEGKRLAISAHPLGLPDDCARADIVIAFFSVSGADYTACRATLIDMRSTRMRGAHAVWIDKEGNIRVRTAAELRGARPWSAVNY